ncbi:hypothetical protein BZJ18_07255 [Salinivibrio sp. IB872]|nr:hypothetical protein BZJ18_07255 [Salinivibrio sp. IB872]
MRGYVKGQIKPVTPSTGRVSDSRGRIYQRSLNHLDFYEVNLPACTLVEGFKLIHSDLQIEIEAVIALYLVPTLLRGNAYLALAIMQTQIAPYLV